MPRNISESTLSKEFRPQTLGIDTFPFPYIAVPTPLHGNEIPTLLCRNFIPMSLHGNEIPTKCCGNEIPTNHPLELYTIYNPAPPLLYMGFVTQCDKSLLRTTIGTSL